MNQYGRVSFLTLAGLFAVVVVAVVLLFSREGLGSIGGQFMSALAKHDVATLTEMSYLGKDSPDEIRSKWDLAVNHYGKYYRFHWKITDTKQNGDSSGAIRLQVARNSDSQSTYDENFQIPVLKVDGKWKIDVAGINSTMFPGIPR